VPDPVYLPPDPPGAYFGPGPRLSTKLRLPVPPVSLLSPLAALLLVLTPLVLLALSFRKRGAGARESLLLGALAWGVALTLLTEALSALSLLTRGGVAAGWVLVSGAAYLALRRAPGTSGWSRIALPRLRGADALLAGGTAALLLLVGVVAVAAPPNTWDSLTYHMGRVVHWAQNGSVAPYPTHVQRQLFLNPWAEFALLHLYLLGGGDRLANLVQWGALAGCVAGVTLLARRLGAGRRGQLAAAAFCASAPMALMQASGTKNDLVVAFWLVCLADGVLRGRQGTGPALAVGAALGLAMLTKGTGYVYAFPFLVWWSVARLRAEHARALLPLGAAALLALTLNAGYYARNLEVYGRPLGPGAPEFPLANETFTPSALASNVVRNVMIHLGTPVGPVDLFLQRVTIHAHRAVGAPFDDPRTTWPGTRFFVQGPSFQEDTAGNPLHVVVIVLSLGVLLARGELRRGPALPYFAALVAAFLLFCLYLKWQIWHSRLHVGLFVLAAPAVGVALARGIGARAAGAAGLLLLLAGLPWAVRNAGRPLLGSASVLRVPRDEQYTAADPERGRDLRAAARFLAERRCRDVGVVIDEDGWNYPLSVALDRAAGRHVRLHHVGVANPSASAREGRPAGPPCAVAVVGEIRPGKSRFSPRGRAPAFRSEHVEVFLADGAPAR